MIETFNITSYFPSPSVSSIENHSVESVYQRLCPTRHYTFTLPGPPPQGILNGTTSSLSISVSEPGPVSHTVMGVYPLTGNATTPTLHTVSFWFIRYRRNRVPPGRNTGSRTGLLSARGHSSTYNLVYLFLRAKCFGKTLIVVHRYCFRPTTIIIIYCTEGKCSHTVLMCLSYIKSINTMMHSIQ